MCDTRHNPSPALAGAIREARAELREGRVRSTLGIRMSVANLALWRRNGAMRSWSYDEIMRGSAGHGSYPTGGRRMFGGTWYDMDAWRAFRDKVAARRRAA
jgi:hypothetical protein